MGRGTQSPSWDDNTSAPERTGGRGTVREKFKEGWAMSSHTESTLLLNDGHATFSLLLIDVLV